MAEFKCPFCGSKEIKLKKPYVQLNRKGEYEPATGFCCKAQAQNQKYIDKHFDPIINKKPDVDEVSKW